MTQVKSLEVVVVAVFVKTTGYFLEVKPHEEVELREQMEVNPFG